jgi:hypothetical protein
VVDLALESICLLNPGAGWDGLEIVIDKSHFGDGTAAGEFHLDDPGGELPATLHDASRSTEIGTGDGELAGQLVEVLLDPGEDLLEGGGVELGSGRWLDVRMREGGHRCTVSVG